MIHSLMAIMFAAALANAGIAMFLGCCFIHCKAKQDLAMKFLGASMLLLMFVMSGIVLDVTFTATPK